MSNGIDIRQNEDKSIAMLAAQRQLYKYVKKSIYMVIMLSLIIPFCISVLVVFVSQTHSIMTISYIISIAGIIISDLAIIWSKRKKELAAYIQQKFDVYVYQMPWDTRLFGEERNVNSDISKYSKDILSDENKKRELENWYSKPATEKPILEGILTCQRENYSWDYELRQRIRNYGIAVAVTLIILVFAIGVLNKESVVSLIGRLAFIAPIFKLLYGLFFSLNEDMERLKKMEVKINSGETKNMEDLQEIQRDLYIHRKECCAIPDLIYNMCKKKDEEREKRSALL